MLTFLAAKDMESPKLIVHIHVKVSMVIIIDFPTLIPNQLVFRCKIKFSYLVATIMCFALRTKTNWFGESRETNGSYIVPLC